MAISGSVEAVQSRLEKDRLADLQRHFDAAFGSIQRAAVLTQRLLAFSRKQPLDPSATDVNQLMKGSEDLVRHATGDRVELMLKLYPDLWLAMLDPHQLQNALLNLCTNARDAMPDGGTITIESSNARLAGNSATALELPAGDYVRLDVTDTGFGMADDVVERAFDPFFTTKPVGEGTGLGLSMVHGFVHQSGGQIDIRSRQNIGTQVCLYLPRYTGPQNAMGQAVVEGDAAVTSAGQRIVVIDDEAIIRMLVVNVLEEAGFHVTEAFDGASGLKVLENEAQVDLLITDVGLPGGINGRQLADAVRITRPSLKVLFITGYAEQIVSGDRPLEDGMFILSKPFLMEELLKRTQDILAI